MAVYEVVLRFQDREEVRVTDQPLQVGNSFQIGGQRWLVEAVDARRGQAVRCVCVKLRERPSAVNGRETMLSERFAAAEPESLRGERGGDVGRPARPRAACRHYPPPKPSMMGRSAHIDGTFAR